MEKRIAEERELVSGRIPNYLKTPVQLDTPMFPNNPRQLQ
jgi:hypothetical protein